MSRPRPTRSLQEARGVRCFADMDGMRGLPAFLMEDCCGLCPDLCRPVLD